MGMELVNMCLIWCLLQINSESGSSIAFAIRSVDRINRITQISRIKRGYSFNPRRFGNPEANTYG